MLIALFVLATTANASSLILKKSLSAQYACIVHLPDSSTLNAVTTQAHVSQIAADKRGFQFYTDTMATLATQSPLIVNFTGLAAAYCVNAANSLLTGSMAPYGNFYGSGITANGNGTAFFSPAVTGVGGPFAITYTYTDAYGNTSTSTQYTTVYALPVVAFTGLADHYCVNDSTVLLIGNHEPFGSFIGPGITDLCVGKAFFDPSLAGVGGPYSITYTYMDFNACANTSVETTVVDSLANPSISGPATACAGSNQVYTTQAGMSNYTWAVSGGGAIITGASTNTISVLWNTAGAQTVSVNYANAGGCTALAPCSYDVTVNTTPSPSISGPATACTSSTQVYTTQAGMSNYTWAVSTGGTIITGASTNTISVIWNTAGAQTVSVNYTNGEGCTAAAPSNYVVTVHATPSPSISGPATACTSSTQVYTTQAGMSNYTWAVSAGGTITTGASTNIISVLWNTTGAQTVSVNYTTPQGCTASAASVYTVVVGDGIVPTISGTSNLCINTGNYAYTTESGMSNYLWGVSSGGNLVSGAGTNQIQVAWTTAGAQNISVNYTANANCPTLGAGNLAISVAEPPTSSGIISGEALVCEGSMGVNYSTTPIANASMYVWQLPAGATIASGAGSPNILVDFNAGASSGPMFVTGNNSCGNGNPSTAFEITVVPTPTAPTITLSNDILMSNAPTGNQWYLDGVAIAGAVQQDFEPMSAGDYHATVTLDGCTSMESNHLWVSLTGIGMIEDAIIRVYPNPSNGDVQVKWPSAVTGQANVKLINALGEIVHNQQFSLNKGVGKLNFASLAQGLYMLKIEFNNQTLTTRVLISD